MTAGEHAEALERLRQHLLAKGVVPGKVVRVMSLLQSRQLPRHRKKVTLWGLVRAAADSLWLDLASQADNDCFSVQGMMRVGLTPEAAFALVHQVLARFPDESGEDFVYHYSCGHWLGMHLEAGLDQMEGTQVSGDK